jgi:hypothetical protein
VRLVGSSRATALALAMVCAQMAGAQTLCTSVAPGARGVYGDQPPKAGAAEKTMPLESLPVSVVPGTRAGSAPHPVRMWWLWTYRGVT